MENIIHRRLIAGSSLLETVLIELGFKKVGISGGGTKRVTQFQKGEKVVKSSFYGIEMYIDYGNNKKLPVYSGTSIHDKILIHFANEYKIAIQAKTKK